MVDSVSWLVTVHVSHSTDLPRVNEEDEVDETLELDHPPVGTSAITVTSVAPEEIGRVVVEV